MAMTMEQAVKRAIAHVQDYVDGQGTGEPVLSKGSADNYLRRLKSFEDSEDFMNLVRTPIEDVNTEDLEAWLEASDMSPSVRHQAISALRLIGRINNVAFPGAEALESGRGKVKKKDAVVFYGPSDLKKLLAAPPAAFGFKHPERNKALVSLVIGTMADIDEIQAMRFEDVMPDGIVMRLRPIPENHFELPANIMEPLRAHMATVNERFPDRRAAMKGSTRLFLKNNNTNDPLKRGMIWLVVSQAIEKVLGTTGGADQGVHALRVSAARALYATGHGENRIRAMLRLGDYAGALEQFLHMDEQLASAREKAVQKHRIYGVDK